MPNTTNFNFPTPADTDLVKDGASAIRSLGNSIDTAFVDLKGGTTGQILSKASNTDLDYTWITNDVGDITEVQAGTGITVTSGTGPIPTVALTTPVAATNGGTAQSTYTTGDLLYASGTNTLAKRAIGSTGNVLTVSGGVPTWAAPAGGGGMTLLSTTTLSGSSTTITIDPTGYNNLQFDIFLVDCSADANWSFKPNNSTSVLMRIQDGAQNTYADGIAIPLNTDGTLKLTTTTNAWTVIINNVASSTSHKPIWFYGGGVRNSAFGRTVSMGYGRLESTSTITSFVFACSAGTFNGGTIKTYGVK